MPQARIVREFLHNQYVENLKTVYKSIYFFLCCVADVSALGIVCLSHKRIALETDVSERVLSSFLATLAEAGQIVVDEHKRILLTEFIDMHTGYENVLLDRSGAKEYFVCLYKACRSARFQTALQQRYPLLFSQLAVDQPPQPCPKMPTCEARSVQTDESGRSAADSEHNAPSSVCSLSTDEFEASNPEHSDVCTTLLHEHATALLRQAIQALDKEQTIDNKTPCSTIAAPQERSRPSLPPTGARKRKRTKNKRTRSQR